jgi:hypothetical protein
MSEVQIAIEFIQNIFISGLIGGTLVVGFVQFLKSNFVPSQLANKYPRITTAVISLLASLALTYTQCAAGAAACVELVKTPVGIVSGTIAIFIVAVLIYNNVLRDKPQS